MIGEIRLSFFETLKLKLGAYPDVIRIRQWIPIYNIVNQNIALSDTIETLVTDGEVWYPTKIKATGIVPNQLYLGFQFDSIWYPPFRKVTSYDYGNMEISCPIPTKEVINVRVLNITVSDRVLLDLTIEVLKCSKIKLNTFLAQYEMEED